MEKSIFKTKTIILPKFGTLPLYVIIVGFVFILAVLQDYIFSRLQDTGFYVSESLLYNTFWAYFIPFTFLSNHLVKRFKPKSKLSKFSFYLGTGVTFSVLHIAVFTAVFVFVSNLVFTPPHRFSTIFNAAFSNQFYIALVWYVIFPVLYTSTRKPQNLTVNYPEKIKLKIGLKTISVPTTAILYISTDKPYSLVYTHDQKILDNKSLKEFETELDPTLFLRVHRSTIINATYIKELKSRQNGDYDARLENNETIRLSRHYRKNWKQLLQ